MDGKSSILPPSRSDLAAALAWHRQAFAIRAVLAAGLLGSSSLWVDSPVRFDDYVTFFSSLFVGVIYILVGFVLTSHAEIVLAADARCVEEYRESKVNLRKWQGLQAFGYLQIACLFVAIASAISSFGSKLSG
ncbi:MAG: hypothetical protein RBS39_11310 [Phycisphaerales bacterium]|jgi:hypothetical protein|nr:hypothetical protein [Phycisphaerales bacterium]